ncbi:MAG TPA: P-type conjugative transfer protein TrbL [Alphaproteobacteria bacterium]|nr:P-type conjugative transfer protein TrbL [Alphaproteobacteria bacterium]
MGGVSVIDQFLNVFTTYIDSGFGLLGPEVTFLTAVLAGIDMTLAGLFWAMGGEGLFSERLIKKTLYIGFFALLLSNFYKLAGIVFNSFASLGLLATGSTLTYAQFLQPGRIAHVGIDAGRPLLTAVGGLMGFTNFFTNFVQIVVLLLAWLLVVIAFFILAVQLFITILEFKLTALAGFVLVPFGLWGKSAFLAERVLGHVATTGVKVLVLAIVIGIGSTLFSQFISAFPSGAQPTIDQALAVMLASLVMLGLSIFSGKVAAGLVSGAPQLSASEAVGTAAAGAGIAALGGMAFMGGGRLALGGIRAAATAMGGAEAAYAAGGAGSGGVAGGLASVARAGASAVTRGPIGLGERAAQSLQESYAARRSASEGSGTMSSAPGWAQRLRGRHLGNASHVAQAAGQGGHAGQGASPELDPEGN